MWGEGEGKWSLRACAVVDPRVLSEQAAKGSSDPSRRYIPSVNDAVVGVITQRHSENYTVDIFGPWPALLPSLAFEGVARRNRPNLKIGDVVYCRVEEAARDVDPMLTCVDATGKVGGWGMWGG